MHHPKADDNFARTVAAYVPLVAACRPDLDQGAAKRKAFELVTTMQQAFLRSDVLSDELGVDLRDTVGREAFHRQVLHDILEV